MSDWPQLMPFFRARRGGRFALVTLAAKGGSSYRPVGARLLVADDGAHAGSLSGGCLEDEVAAEAVRVLASGKRRIHEIDTRPHFGCPGRLTLVIEPLPEGWLASLDERLARRATFWVSTGHADEAAGPGSVLHDQPPAATKGCFVETVGPAKRVVVVSGTSDADHVVRLGELLGWEMRRVLPAGDRAGPGDGARDEVCLPEEVVRRFAPDAGTAVVVMTHHLARDLHYLRAVLPEAYSYVGLLGSARRREQLLGELGETGVLADDSVAGRLHAPVGLDLGATDPASVALAIVAEIQAAWTGRSGARLRESRR